MFRTRRAICRAISTLGVSRLMLKQIRGHPGPDGGGPASGVDGIRPEVRLPQGVLHLLRQPLELSLADVGQVHPVGGSGRLLIEVEGLSVEQSGFLCYLPGQLVRLPEWCSPAPG